MKIKKKILIFLLLIVVLAGVGLYFQEAKSEETSPRVQFQETKVQRDDIVVGFESDGEVDFSKVTLRFGVNGTISEILVKEGDQVKKGDVIAKLADQDYQEEYQLALAKLKDSKEDELTNLWDSELSLDKMEAELNKLRDEYQEMVEIPEAYSESELKIKKQDLDNKELEYANAQKKHELLVKNYEDNELDQNELAVEVASENLEDTILYAPVDGTILDLANKAGESLTDEEDFATIHENNQYKVLTRVIEYDISQIKVGQKVTIAVEAIPDKEYRGEVISIDALPTTDNSGLVSYEVEVEINNPDIELKDGMTCTVNFILKEVTDCLIVPYEAVKIVDSKQFVTVLDDKSEKVNKEIKTGFTDGTDVEVLEGLEVNDTVVIEKVGD